MESIQHKIVRVNGIQMHVAEKGGEAEDSQVILFLHGFPELWYTWRHQMLALSSLGYRAIAPDLRGYGDTEAPGSITSYTSLHIVGDLIALMDSLGVEKVFVVAHDWGAIIAWHLCLFRPERVKAFFCLSELLILLLCSQEPGKIEAEIDRWGAKEVLKRILTSRKPGPPCWAKENPFGINPERPITLPPWLSEEDLDYYATKFNQSGFTGGLNYYRALDLNWELTATWTGAVVKTPVKYVVGELDSVYTTPGIKEYVDNGGFKKDVPLLEEIVVMEM
ncbi:hypothetical protein Dsin_021407 [Dipteronia sinensis]|uniref:AB hydrolase-1 domain-containing protein n=1 Tax=Dipteronia sinensis TaxID=43782 RepID=A0AAE0A0L8_9ROSI|nr:hypothetical protein Dsin_021407 [Dipteronia sinensis]